MSSSSNRGLHLGLWVLQVLLGLMMMGSGANKLFSAIDELVKMGMTWAPDYGAGFVRFLGVCLVLGGLGLILPAATRILPWLTPLAGAMLALYFVLATAFHLQRGESPVVTLVITLLCAFVAFGRFKLAPIAAKA
jgi:hypothetical protein